MTEEERLWQRVDSVKSFAKDGDLVTRLNDNLVSHQIRFLNTKDRSFSHAGIVMTINDTKTVCHIDAGINGADTIRYEPIDSFLNPRDNLDCGLYRYDLSEDEINSFITGINEYHAQRVHFDHAYGLDTDSVMYCSEMIYKTMKKATNDRVVIETTLIPRSMVKTVWNYMLRKFPLESIEKVMIVPIDNLYLMPHCKEILRFKLKQFPGQ